MQRLFVAVEIPPAVRSHVATRLQPWQDVLPGWRWGDPETWHLTLAFLGAVEQRPFQELRRRLVRAGGRHPAFALALGTLGAFSRPARAQVLWLGVTTGREPLVRLAGTVSAAARRSKIDVEQRPYRPHLTLGRRRSPVDLREQLKVGTDLHSPAWTVGSFVLVESHLGAQVRHEVVDRFELTADR